MNAEIFIAELRDLAPAREELEEYGLDETEIDSIQSCFLAEQRQLNSPGTVKSELNSLLEHFSCDSIEIAGVIFNASVATLPQGEHFASLEADPLVIEPCGTIAWFDHASTDSDFHRKVCAENGGAFLEAMIFVATVWRNKRLWKDRMDEAVSRCVVASNSPESQDFYATLLAGMR